MIPYGRQHITEADIEAVVEVLRSDFLTQGPLVPRFEQAIADYCRAGHGVAVNSATSALHIACLALDLGPGDWLWTSAITFVASANCALYCGAKVDFVDIDPGTYNLSLESLTRKLERAEKENRLPKVLVPVHLCGQSCDMDAISDLSQRYGFRVIEDASHAIGGHYKNDPVGRCCYSDITVFSFHPVKVITTGEGGMAMTNDPELAARMARLRSHGITREPGEMNCEPDGPWYYEQIELGFNYRMTDMQAALGLSQLQRLDRYVTRRHELADQYDEVLSETPIVLPRRQSNSYSSLHLYVVRVPASNHRWIFDSLRGEGVGINLHYIPVYRQPYYRRMGFAAGDFPGAESYYREAISLPIFPELTDQQQMFVTEQLLSLVGSAVEA